MFNPKELFDSLSAPQSLHLEITPFCQTEELMHNGSYLSGVFSSGAQLMSWSQFGGAMSQEDPGKSSL